MTGACDFRDTKAYQSMSFAHNPYGDSKACRYILEVLTK